MVTCSIFSPPVFEAKITTFKTMPQQQQHTRPNSITRAFIQSARNERHALEGLINLSAPFRPFTHRRSAWHIKSMPQRQPFYGRIIEEIRKEQVKQESSSDGSPGSPMEECRGLWLSTRTLEAGQGSLGCGTLSCPVSATRSLRFSLMGLQRLLTRSLQAWPSLRSTALTFATPRRAPH